MQLPNVRFSSIQNMSRTPIRDPESKIWLRLCRAALFAPLQLKKGFSIKSFFPQVQQNSQKKKIVLDKSDFQFWIRGVWRSLDEHKAAEPQAKLDVELQERS